MTLNPLIVDFVDATLKHQVHRLLDEKISIETYRDTNEQKITDSESAAIKEILNKVDALTRAFENAKAVPTINSLKEFLNYGKPNRDTKNPSSDLSIIEAAKIQRGTFSKKLNLQTKTLANLTSKSHLYAIKIFQQDPTITDPKTKYTTPEEANTLLNEIGNEYLGDPNWGNNNKIGGGLFSSTAQNFEEFNIEVAKNLEFLATMQKLQEKDKEANLIGESYTYNSKNPDNEKKIIEELDKINAQIQEIKIDLTDQTKENSDILVSLKKSTSQSIQHLKLKIDLKKQIAEIAEINVSIIGAQHIEKTKDEANQKLNSLRNNIEKIIIENNSEPNIQFKKEISDLCNTASNAIKNKTTELEKNIKNALDTSQKHRNEIIGTITDSQNNQQNKSKDFEAVQSKIMEQLASLTSQDLLSDKDKASVDEALNKLDVTIQEAKKSEAQAKQEFDSLISKAVEKPIFNDNDIASTTKVSEKYNAKISLIDEAHITNLSQKMREEDQKTVDSIVKQTLSTIKENENLALTDIKHEITKINENVNKVDIENSFTNVFSLKTLDDVKDTIEQELNSRIAEIAKFDISDTQAVRTTIESHRQKLQDCVAEVKNHFQKLSERKNEISNLASNPLVTEALTSIDQTTSFSALESIEENLKQKFSQLDYLKTEINEAPPISKINISNDHLTEFNDVQKKANLAISAKIKAIENLQREIIQHKNNLNQAAQSIIQSIKQDTTVGNYDVKTTNADIQKQYSEDIKKIEAMADNPSQFSKEDQSQINQAIKDKLSELATQFDTTLSKRNQITEKLQNDVEQTLSYIQAMGAATFGELTNSQTNLTDQIAQLESTIQTYNISEDLTDLKDTLKNQAESIADDIVKTAITDAQQTNISKLASIKEVTEHQQKTTDALKALEGQIPDNASSTLKEKINTTIKTINQKSDAKIDTFINAKNTLISEIKNKALDLNARLDLALKIGDIETLEEEIKQSNDNFKLKSEAIDESLRHEIEPLLENLKSCHERSLAKIEEIRGQIQSQQQALSALNPESFMATVDSKETLNKAKTQYSQEIEKIQTQIKKFAPEDVKTLEDEIKRKNNTFDGLTSKVTAYFSEIQSNIEKINSKVEIATGQALPNINLDASFTKLEEIKGNLNDQATKLNELKSNLQSNQAPSVPSFINAEPQQNQLKQAIEHGLAKIDEQLTNIAIKQTSINNQQTTLQAQAQQRLQDINNINSSKDIDVKNSDSDIKKAFTADINAIEELKNSIDKFSAEDQAAINKNAKEKVSELEQKQDKLLLQRQNITKDIQEQISKQTSLTSRNIDKANTFAGLNKISDNATHKLNALAEIADDYKLQNLEDSFKTAKDGLQSSIEQRKDTIKQNFIKNNVEKIDTKVEAATIAEAKIQFEQKSNLINQVKTKATEILSNEVSSAELGIDSKETELKSNFNHNIQTIVYLAIAEQANKDYSNLTTFTDVEQNTTSSIETLQEIKNSLPAELSDSYTKPIIDDIQKTIEQIHQKSEKQNGKFIQQQKTMLLKIDTVNSEQINDAKSISETQSIKDKLSQELQKLDINKIEPSLQAEVQTKLDEKLSQINNIAKECQNKFQNQIDAKIEFDKKIEAAKAQPQFLEKDKLSTSKITKAYDDKITLLNRLNGINDLESKMSDEDKLSVQPALTAALNLLNSSKTDALSAVQTHINNTLISINSLNITEGFTDVDSTETLSFAQKTLQAEIDSLAKEIKKLDKDDAQSLETALKSAQDELKNCVTEIKAQLKTVSDLANKISGLGNSSQLSASLPTVDDSTSFSALESTEDNLKQQLNQLDSLKTEINKQPPISKISISDNHLKKVTDAQIKTNQLIDDKIKAIENLQASIENKKTTLHENSEKLNAEIQSKQSTGSINPSKSVSEIKATLETDSKILTTQFSIDIDKFSSDDQEKLTKAISNKVKEFESLANAAITKLQEKTENVRAGIQEVNGLFDFKSKKSVDEIDELKQSIQEKIDILETTLTDVDADQRQELASQVGKLKINLEQRSQQRLGVLKAEEKAQIIINTIESTKIDAQASSKELDSQIELLTKNVNLELNSTYIKTDDRSKIKALLDSKASDFDNAIEVAKTKEAIPINAKIEFDELLTKAQVKPILTGNDKFSTTKINAAYNDQKDLIKEDKINILRQQMNKEDKKEIGKLVNNAKAEINQNRDTAIALIKNEISSIQKMAKNLDKNIATGFSSVDSVKSLAEVQTRLQTEIENIQIKLNRFDPEDVAEITTMLQENSAAVETMTKQTAEYLTSVENSIANIENQTQSLVNTILPKIDDTASTAKLDRISKDLDRELVELNQLMENIKSEASSITPLSFIISNAPKDKLDDVVKKSEIDINLKIESINALQSKINEVKEELHSSADNIIQSINDLNFDKYTPSTPEAIVEQKFHESIAKLKSFETNISQYSKEDQAKINQAVQEKITALTSQRDSFLEERSKLREEIKSEMQAISTTITTLNEPSFVALDEQQSKLINQISALASKAKDNAMPKLKTNITELETKLTDHIQSQKNSLKEAFAQISITPNISTNSISEARNNLKNQSEDIKNLKDEARRIFNGQVSIKELGISQQGKDLHTAFERALDTIVDNAIGKSAKTTFDNASSRKEVNDALLISIKKLDDLRHDLGSDITETHRNNIDEQISKLETQANQRTASFDNALTQFEGLINSINKLNDKAISGTLITEKQERHSIDAALTDAKKILNSLSTEEKESANEKLMSTQASIDSRRNTQKMIAIIDHESIAETSSSAELEAQKVNLTERIKNEIINLTANNQPIDNDKVSKRLAEKIGLLDQTIKISQAKEDALDFQTKLDAIINEATTKPKFSAEERNSTATVTKKYQDKIDYLETSIIILIEKCNENEKRDANERVKSAKGTIQENQSKRLSKISEKISEIQKKFEIIDPKTLFLNCKSSAEIDSLKNAFASQILEIQQSLTVFDKSDTNDLLDNITSKQADANVLFNDLKIYLAAIEDKKSELAGIQKDIDSKPLKVITLDEKTLKDLNTLSAEIDVQIKSLTELSNQLENVSIPSAPESSASTLGNVGIVDSNIQDFEKTKTSLKELLATKIKNANDLLVNVQKKKTSKLASTIAPELLIAQTKSISNDLRKLSEIKFDSITTLSALTIKRAEIHEQDKVIQQKIDSIPGDNTALQQNFNNIKQAMTSAIRAQGADIIKASLTTTAKTDFNDCNSNEAIDTKALDIKNRLKDEFVTKIHFFDTTIGQHPMKVDIQSTYDKLLIQIDTEVTQAKELLLKQQQELEEQVAKSATKTETKALAKPAEKVKEKEPILYGHLTGETIQDFFTKKNSGDPKYHININCHQLQLSRLDKQYQGDLHTAKGIKILSDSGQKFEFCMDQGIPKARLAHSETQPQENETQAQTDARLADTLMTMMDNIIANGNQIRINTKSPMDAAICQQYLKFLMTEGGLTNLKASINGETINADTSLENVLCNKALCSQTIIDEKVADRAKAAFNSVMSANVDNTEKPGTYANYKDYLEKDVVSTMKKSIAIKEPAQNDEQVEQELKSPSMHNHH